MRETELLERLVTLTESMARQTGWLPDDELIAAYDDAARARRMGYTPAVVLTPPQERLAEVLRHRRATEAVSAAEAAVAEAAERWARAHVEGVTTRLFMAQDEAKRNAGAAAQLGDAAAVDRYRQEARQWQELIDLPDETLAQKIRGSERLYNLGYGDRDPLLKMAAEVARALPENAELAAAREALAAAREALHNTPAPGGPDMPTAGSEPAE
ncbi:MAG: hypothetical protein AMXMBFR83_25210 [Phycisphaerae bacterium]